MRVEERKALQSILHCRTPVMGGRSYRCTHCDKDHFAWHSCNHRLCPRCGSSGTQAWVADRLQERLRVEHFMVTFTLPAQLRGLCRYKAKAFLSAFFACSAQAIKDVLQDPRQLGGSCGFIGSLQTWTQDLRLHPHIHYIVPAVGLDAKGKLKRLKKAGWLARGEVFAGRLKTLLIKALEKETLLSSSLSRKLWAIKWNCDVESFGEGSNAIKYLGGYVCKGPLCDSRIRSADADRICISVKNRKSGSFETRDIKPVEFVRRYLQHALPRGFHAIRYHGFMHPRAKAQLAAIRRQLGLKLAAAKKKETRGKDDAVPMRCPRCGKPMEMTAQLSRAPPWERSIPKIWARRERAAA